MATNVTNRMIYTLRIKQSFTVSGKANCGSQYVTLLADRSDGTHKSWQIENSQLLSALSCLMGTALARVACADLEAGRSTNLPGTYSPSELVELGFRTLSNAEILLQSTKHLDEVA